MTCKATTNYNQLKEEYLLDEEKLEILLEEIETFEGNPMTVIVNNTIYPLPFEELTKERERDFCILRNHYTEVQKG